MTCKSSDMGNNNIISIYACEYVYSDGKKCKLNGKMFVRTRHPPYNDPEKFPWMCEKHYKKLVKDGKVIK